MDEAFGPIRILMADDDEDDRLMTKEALEEARLLNTIDFVHDGVELIQYLKNESPYEDAGENPRPDLILLDLNMPRKSGREALEEIKADPKLKRIPVVILTTSEADTDIIRSYDLGASSFIVKPVSFDGLVKTMEGLSQYWTQIVRLPPRQ